MKTADKKVQAGISLYSKFTLRFYDLWGLRFGCDYALKCPARVMLNHYNTHVSSNHLDIGAGSGYFPDRCNFPVPSPRVALMDLSRNCLETAAGRIKRYKPEIYRSNVLEPVTVEIETFDSVAIMNVIHCLPGTMKDKTVVFRHLREVLNPGGVLFGSTVLGKGAPRNFWGKVLLKFCNSRGYMTNYEDDYNSLKQGLEEQFRNVSIKLVGSVALFSGQKRSGLPRT